MLKPVRIVPTFILLLVFILSSCNLPTEAQETEEPNAIFTQAALTVQAQLQEATPFSTPTLPPPAPTNTAITFPTSAAPATATLPPASSATPVCDQAQFIKDVTIPDGTVVSPNEAFTKTWRLKNVGNCTWSGYSLVFDSGESMNGTSPIAIGTVNPGQEIDLSVNLTAPSTNGSYRSYWRIRNASGILLPVLGGHQNKSFFADIEVDDGSGGPFAVTSVSLSSSGTCGNFTITANITVNGPGSVTYKWRRSDNATDNANHAPIVFTEAGTKSVDTQWFVGASGSHWMDIYIDDPNHQQFGRANFSCP